MLRFSAKSFSLFLLIIEKIKCPQPPPPHTAHLPVTGGWNGTRYGGCNGGIQADLQNVAGMAISHIFLSLHLARFSRALLQGYPSSWPNAHYYKRYCRTYFGLAVVTDSLASDAALERTAWTLDSMMMRMESYVADRMAELGFRQAVMGSYPSETVPSLPEYSNLDPNFWNTRRGCGATVGSPVGCNAEEDVLCYSSDLYPDMDITVHEVLHRNSLF